MTQGGTIVMDDGTLYRSHNLCILEGWVWADAVEVLVAAGDGAEAWQEYGGDLAIPPHRVKCIELEDAA